jgi:thiamine kinase-like enzyme
LETCELHNIAIADAVVRRMSQLHLQFTIPSHLQLFHSPSKPSLWNQLDTWFLQAKQIEMLSPLSVSWIVLPDVNNHGHVSLSSSSPLQAIQLELEWLRKVIPSDAKLAFCHNDLLAANILYDDPSNGSHTNNEDNDTNHADDDSPHVLLIDFEYGGCNYCAFDLANFFNEFAGGTVDGIPNYDDCPSTSVQIELITCYLQEQRNQQHQNPIPNGVIQVANDEVETWLRHVSIFQLASHLYWVLWAILQAHTKGCDDFNYQIYANCRLAQYYKSKRGH